MSIVQCYTYRQENTEPSDECCCNQTSRTRFRTSNMKSLFPNTLTCIVLMLWAVSTCGGEQTTAPRFITQPSSATPVVSEGRHKILQCSALGHPQPQYQWRKDGQPLTLDFSSDHFYKIYNTKREDAGRYRCVARNTAGSVFSENIDVTVAYMGQFEDLTERTVSVEYGEAAVLDFPTIESHPPPSVKWMADDGANLYDRKYVTTLDNKFIILQADKDDEKAYRARATNTILGKEENSAYVRLVVGGDSNREVEPTLIVSPKNISVVKGEPQALLQCIANARPLHLMETLWFKDGIPIEASGVNYAFSDPWNLTLSLVGANLTHTGLYSCQARLRNGEFSALTASASVVVLEKPSFTSSLRAETLGEYGSTVTLSCEAVGVQSPTITWYRNAEPVEQLQEDRYSVIEGGSLVIRKLHVEDQGVYQCLASNEAGEDSAYTWLKVKTISRQERQAPTNIVRVRHFDLSTHTSVGTSSPVMETPPQNVTVLDGKDATIFCRAMGAPSPNITWFYEDDKPLETSGRIQIIEETGDLFIAAVRNSDAGAYTCIRSNEAGSVEAKGFLSVLVRTQIIQPPVDTRVLLGHTATLQCKVSNDPSVPFDIAWFQNHRRIISGSSQRVNVQRDGTLEIQAVRASDVGNYTCAVISSGGNETRSARLSVIELPYAPVNVRAVKQDTETRRAINVSWTPGFDGNSPILKYIVQKREVSELVLATDPILNWITELSNVSANNRWVLLTNLKAAASYQFRVSAVNSVGEGSPSEPSHAVTLPQEPPSGPPVGFVGSARSSSEIITQWQPPLEEHRNGQILGYVIRYRLFGYYDSPWMSHNVTNEAQRNYLIQDLITWKDYTIQIAAYNNMGVGVFSDGVKIKTREGVPEAPPTEVRAEAVNSTAIKVWWKPPDPQKINGINQGYKLQAWKGDPENGGKEAVARTVPPSLLDPLAEQTAFITGLEKFTLYNITVLCFTDPGDGKRSEAVVVSTLEDVPDEVGSLQFDEVSDRSVKVLWSSPKKANGVLIGYTLTYSEKDQPESSVTLNFTADTYNVTVQPLQALTHYRFEVAAWTGVGPGPVRVATIQSGIEPVLPEPPTKLAVSNIEAFSVVVQFTPGFDGNSSITQWIVEAQTSRNITWFPIFELSDPDATTITVTGLVPFMQYRLRIISRNVVGTSQPSEPTKDFQTIQAPPAHPPRNVTVRAMSAKQLRVRWIPLQQFEWFGNPRGYNISYKEVGGRKQSAIIEDHTANSAILEGLEEFTEYSVTMQAFNDVGSSKVSPAAVERTREAVPSSGPVNVEANATSSTTIVVKWGNVVKEDQNGLIEGFKVYYGALPRLPFQYKKIASNSTFTTTLTELRKFEQYHIQVLAYTRLGDGALSAPPVRVRTFDDTPGAPSNVSFPDVSLTSARIIWDVPDEPNGEILAYMVTYNINDQSGKNFSREFLSSARTFRATELEPEQYYMFSVTAQTQLGWGRTAHALVYTTSNRERPQPPSAPQVSRSQVQSSQITFSWTPGRDGFAPLRYYIVQYMENGGPWQSESERLDPQVTSHTAMELKPFTTYQFRIQAVNDIGPSGWSQESEPVRTLPAAPSRGVNGVKVVPITTTSVRVEWQPLEESFWSGDHETGGYRIEYQPVNDFPTLANTPKVKAEGIKTNNKILSDLTRDRTYEIVVAPVNSQGSGPPSPPATVYVGEAVPTGEPRDVVAEPVSPTEVRLRWKPPAQSQQNGDLLGYKIFYLVTDSPQDSGDLKIEEELEVVPASHTYHSLVFLDKYTQYRIQILAFNPAGDGPRSSAISVRTAQGLPGPPTNLRFSDITMSSLKMLWDPPKKRNGIIKDYIVTYETAEENKRFSKQVKQSVSDTSLMIASLEEQVTYVFTVRAQTIDYGPAVSGNVTTGPQEGSPATPKDLSLTKTLSSVDLHWINGPSGKGPILGYYIQSRRKALEDWDMHDVRWQTVTQTSNGPLQEFTVSYQNLLPSTTYTFRLIAYNKYGISFPAYSSDAVLTPSKLFLEYGYLQQKPFYRQTWFMVALAATSIIIIIMIIAVLCVKSKSYKYKQEAQKTLEESMAMSIGDHQELALEIYRSRTGGTNALGGVGNASTLGRRGTAVRKSLHQPPVAPMLGKSPPRPSPASVAYHSDEESLKGYDENPDDSSVTEKPSEISSTDSQASESENESERSDPHSFVNHYANVNDSLRQSWKRQKPVRNYSSYTDSEPEGSAVTSLNGGQIIMNNMARSRAPLPGFSSFV